MLTVIISKLEFKTQILSHKLGFGIMAPPQPSRLSAPSNQNASQQDKS
jgi:hypothetical protein